LARRGIPRWHRLRSWVALALALLALAVFARAVFRGRRGGGTVTVTALDETTPDALEVVLRPSSCGKARFGSALAVSGSRLLVGASARDSSEGSPDACLYEHAPGAGWRLVARFARDVHGQYDDFATAVALSGSLVAVNAPGHENGDGPVHFYEQRGATFAGPSLIENPPHPHEEQTYWAESLAFSGGDLLVGAALDVDPGGAETGAVHVFRVSDDPPRLVQRLGPSPVEDGEFGRAIATDGSWVAVGAPLAGIRGRAGKVYLFERTGNALVARGEVHSDVSRPDEFGHALALAGGILVVGAPELEWSAADKASGTGHVELFAQTADTFHRIAELTSPEPQSKAWFGAAIAFDGRRLAIGEPGGLARRGRVWRYEVVGGSVQPLGAWDPTGASSGDWFGSSVSLGPGWIAAGAPSTPSPGRFGRVVVRSW
jgi:hypothetical protein